MAHVEKPPAGNVVTSDARYHRPTSLIFVLVAILVLFVIAGGALYLLKSGPFAAKKSTSTQTKVMTIAQKLQAARAEVQNATNAAQKAAAYNDLGLAYAENNQQAQAVDAYQSALTQNASSGTSTEAKTETQVSILVDLGVSYYRLGEYDKEIASLQQVITLYQASGTPDEKALIPRYQDLIQELQGLEQQ